MVPVGQTHNFILVQTLIKLKESLYRKAREEELPGKAIPFHCH
jgi:hypothetical protein